MNNNCVPSGYTICFQDREEPEFSTVPRAEIDTFPWGCSYRPSTHAHVLALPQAFAVRMVTHDQDVRAEITKLNGPVYTDSCMEFFLMPDPDQSKRYINFEFNALGTLFISIGTNRFDRSNLEIENYKEFFQVRTKIFSSQEAVINSSQKKGRNSSIDDDAPCYDNGWSIEYKIPYDFIQEYFPNFQPREGLVMKGNFFKCGEECKNLHYGCWSHIALPKPDFHSPEYFGTLSIRLK